eukprot:s173_g12.t1
MVPKDLAWKRNGTAPPKPIPGGLWREPGLAMPKSKAPPPMPKAPAALERLQKLKEDAAASLQETQGLSKSLGPRAKVPGPPAPGHSLGPAAAAAAKAAATAKAAAAAAAGPEAEATTDTPAAAEQPASEAAKEATAPTTYWTEVQTEEGDIYYHNEATDETAWELPPGGVVKKPDDDPAAAEYGTPAPNQELHGEYVVIAIFSWFTGGKSRRSDALAAMAGRIQFDEEGEDDRLSDELQKLRNFIEAEFVKQSLHFEEIVEGLKPQAKSMKGQGLLTKTYSSVTLESREFCFDEHRAPPPLAPPPQQPQPVEEVKEERFDETPLRTPREQEARGSHQAHHSSKHMQQSLHSDDAEIATPTHPMSKRSSIQTDHSSLARSEDTFVQSGVKKSMNRAEAAQSVMESSVESVKRLSHGIQRTGSMEIDLDSISPCRSFCYRVVTHWAFANSVMLLILVNLVLLGIEVDTATQLGQLDIPRWFGVVNTLIVCVFLAEITMKFIAFGFKGFLCGKDSFWNNLDFLVIAASVLEIGVELWDLSLSSTQSGSSAAHLRIMRTMRLVRALRGIRVIRLLRYVSALRTLVFSIVSTMGSLMWTLVLLQLLFYSFGVILTQIVSDHCRFEAITKHDDGNAIPECSEELLVKFFKNVPESMCTLLLAISGGLSWDDAFRPLRDVSALAVVLFILYIILTVFAVLNVVTGVFCNTAIESAQSDKDIAIMKQMRKHDAQVQALRHIFKEIDHDKSSHVTLGELQEALSAKKLSSFLESMGISTQDVSTLFMIIDTDRSGMIDLEEFVSGCMQLHGPAKSLQMAQMSHENRVTRQVIKHLANSVSAIKKQLQVLSDLIHDGPIGQACAV